MKHKVLITGGAGFIGSHLARLLLRRGYTVSILDNFSPQIHGGITELPPDLRGDVELFPGDIRDADLCARALAGKTALVHLAAETGTGQSMYRVRHYSDVNVGGTSAVMESLLSGRFSIECMVAASSRAVYGEGAALCAEHGLVYPKQRERAALEAGDFEPKCPVCGRDTALTATPEAAPFQPSSFYGLTKQVQEQMTLLYAPAVGMNAFALRYQNVYGPGQSLKNPYTGILAIFSNLARQNRPVNIFEDGKESRDFVFVDDVVEATARCLEAPPQGPISLNVGTGTPVNVSQVVESILSYFGSSSSISVTGAFRLGDIRHNCADISRIKSVLDFAPAWSFAKGLRSFLDWASAQPIEDQGYDKSLAEMREAGLMHG